MKDVPLILLFLLGLNQYSMKLISALFFLISTSLIAQQKFIVADSLTAEVMPFVKVMPNLGNPLFTDIDGKFSVPSNVQTVELRFQGYKDTTVELSQTTSDTIFISQFFQQFDAVKVFPGENPAHRIINLVIANRMNNHPLKNDAFTYKSYSKFYFDVDDKYKALLMDSTRLDLDSVDQEIAETVKKQLLFLIESASERRFIPPAKDREDIIAYKVSGMTNPLLSTIMQEMQSFHFYDRQFNILGESYINPIGPGGTRRYLFLMEDTTVVNTDTTFTISYRPRRGRDFNGLEGKLFIHTNGYAIERVIAAPYKKTEGSQFKIVQEYKFTDDTKWFPYQLSSQMNIQISSDSSSTKNAGLVGYGNTYIQEVDINPEDMKKRGFGNIALATDPDAGLVDDNTWNGLRKDTLTVKEENTYRIIDSLGKEFNLDRKLEGLTALSTGKLRINKVNVLLDRLIGFNMYEGTRLGLGLETSNRMMKNIAIGGYAGWAFRDEQWKYGAYSTIHLNKRMNSLIKLSYSQDLLHRGGYSYQSNGIDLNSSELVRLLYRKNMETQRKAEVLFQIAPLGNLTFYVSGNYQRIGYNRDYHYLPDVGTSREQGVDVAETSFEVQWNIREKVSLIGDLRVPNGTKFPKISAKITQGLGGVWESDYEYTRINLKVTQKVKLLQLGTIEWTANAAQTIGQTPMFLMHTAIGTRQNWNINVLSTFQTAFPGEFYHDQQASFFVNYKLPTIKTKAKWNEPSFTLTHGIGYGEMKNKFDHSNVFKTMDKGLYEAGLVLDGLYISSFTGIGIGVFYRYGEYAFSDWQNNIVPKLSLSYLFN